MESTTYLADVTTDCDDPERLAAFWAVVLDRPIAGRKGHYVWLERRKVGFGFQKALSPRPGKNRMHVDIAVPDLQVAKTKVEALRGRRASGYEDGGFLVMEDPEGNVFCLIPLSPFNFDDPGHTDYLVETRGGPRRCDGDLVDDRTSSIVGQAGESTVEIREVLSDEPVCRRLASRACPLRKVRSTAMRKIFHWSVKEASAISPFSVSW